MEIDLTNIPNDCKIKVWYNHHGEEWVAEVTKKEKMVMLGSGGTAQEAIDNMLVKAIARALKNGLVKTIKELENIEEDE